MKLYSRSQEEYKFSYQYTAVERHCTVTLCGI